MNTSSTPRLRCPESTCSAPNQSTTAVETTPATSTSGPNRDCTRTDSTPAVRLVSDSPAKCRSRSCSSPNACTRWIADRSSVAAEASAPSALRTRRAASPQLRCGTRWVAQISGGVDSSASAVKTGSRASITTNMPTTSMLEGSSVASICTSMSCVYATSLVTRAVRSPTRCLPWKRSDCRCSRASTDSRRSLATCRPAAASSRVAQ